jgi:hypothetical protein
VGGPAKQFRGPKLPCRQPEHPVPHVTVARLRNSSLTSILSRWERRNPAAPHVRPHVTVTPASTWTPAAPLSLVWFRPFQLGNPKKGLYAHER